CRVISDDRFPIPEWLHNCAKSREVRLRFHVGKAHMLPSAKTRQAILLVKLLVRGSASLAGAIYFPPHAAYAWLFWSGFATLGSAVIFGRPIQRLACRWT